MRHNPPLQDDAHEGRMRMQMPNGVLYTGALHRDHDALVSALASVLTVTGPPPIASLPSAKDYRGNAYVVAAQGRGSITFPNGDSYDGDWEGGSQHGFGSVTFTNGDKYSGDWWVGRPTGEA